MYHWITMNYCPEALGSESIRPFTFCSRVNKTERSSQTQINNREKVGDCYPSATQRQLLGLSLQPLATSACSYQNTNIVRLLVFVITFTFFSSSVHFILKKLRLQIESVPMICTFVVWSPRRVRGARGFNQSQPVRLVRTISGHRHM